MKRVILADDHPVVLAGVAGLIQASGLFQVLATAQNGNDALSYIRSMQPDLAILDISMPQLSGLDVLVSVAEEGLATRIVLLTATLRDYQIARAVRAGAWGLLRKDAASDDLLACLADVVRGQRWLPGALIQEAVDQNSKRFEASQGIEEKLSSRELEIATLVADGLSNKQISRKTGISEGTVKLHLHKVYQKLGLSNRTSLAGLLRP